MVSDLFQPAGILVCIYLAGISLGFDCDNDPVILPLQQIGSGVAGSILVLGNLCRISQFWSVDVKSVNKTGIAEIHCNRKRCAANRLFVCRSCWATINRLAIFSSKVL